MIQLVESESYSISYFFSFFLCIFNTFTYFNMLAQTVLPKIHILDNIPLNYQSMIKLYFKRSPRDARLLNGKKKNSFLLRFLSAASRLYETSAFSHGEPRSLSARWQSAAFRNSTKVSFLKARGRFTLYHETYQFNGDHCRDKSQSSEDKIKLFFILQMKECVIFRAGTPANKWDGALFL